MKIEIEHVSKKIKDALVPVSYTHLNSLGCEAFLVS